MHILSFLKARRTDPETSHQAAEKADTLAEKHAQIICNTLADHGPLGKDGIAAKSSLRPDQVWRRLSELEKWGMIEQTGNTVKSMAGRQEREWMLKKDW